MQEDRIIKLEGELLAMRLAVITLLGVVSALPECSDVLDMITSSSEQILAMTPDRPEAQVMSRSIDNMVAAAMGKRTELRVIRGGLDGSES